MTPVPDATTPKAEASRLIAALLINTLALVYRHTKKKHSASPYQGSAHHVLPRCGVWEKWYDSYLLTDAWWYCLILETIDYFVIETIDYFVIGTVPPPTLLLFVVPVILIMIYSMLRLFHSLFCGQKNYNSLSMPIIVITHVEESFV
uniref:XK-related protein n=1 Tax=Steinernema glaseri TaxID=37863 RepID=A0A1I7ZGP4_9BILA